METRLIVIKKKAQSDYIFEGQISFNKKRDQNLINNFYSFKEDHDPELGFLRRFKSTTDLKEVIFFEKLSLIPLIIVTPLVFLGGSFYSIEMLPDFWQKISLLNPVLYLVSGFKFSFYEISDVSILTSIITILIKLLLCILFIIYIFVKGYNLRN